MKIVILAGGLGTRLRPYTFSIPKPLLPLGDKPLLDYIIEHLNNFNFSEIIISLGYQAELIKAFCTKYINNKIPISFVEEKKQLGTAGSLTLVKDNLIAHEPLFLMNGDIITKLDFPKMLEFHKDNNSSITIASVINKYKSPFGVLEIKDRKVMDVIEKPEYEWPVSAGIYCISQELIYDIPQDSYLTMPELIMQTKEKGGDVFSYPINEYWRALENQDHFEIAMKEIVNSN